MNQEQTKDLLLQIEPTAPEFFLLFTGKASKKVNGLYKPETREILLHNRNFQSDEELVYTAVHEFAHHLHFCSEQRPTTIRSHTAAYWSLFHRLLGRAEQLGVYRNVFRAEPEFLELTATIEKKFLHNNGQTMKDFGQALLQAVQLCTKYHVRFEDYMDRVLCIPRNTAKTVMASFAQDVTPDFGYDHLKLMTTVKDPEIRREMEIKRKEGYSPEMLRQELRGDPVPGPFISGPLDRESLERDVLERNREALQKKIAEYSRKLTEIESKLERLGLEGPDE
ncbi:MAG: hypothetical protein WCG80_01325 [Spirochaetales bacterium]